LGRAPSQAAGRAIRFKSSSFRTKHTHTAGFSLLSLTQSRLATFFVIQQETSWFGTLVEEVSS